MKVKDILKKINGKTVSIPVYLREVATLNERKAISFDFGDYYYAEKEKTVHSIDLLADKVVIYYK